MLILSKNFLGKGCRTTGSVWKIGQLLQFLSWSSSCWPSSRCLFYSCGMTGEGSAIVGRSGSLKCVLGDIWPRSIHASKEPKTRWACSGFFFPRWWPYMFDIRYIRHWYSFRYVRTVVVIFLVCTAVLSVCKLPMQKFSKMKM